MKVKLFAMTLIEYQPDLHEEDDDVFGSKEPTHTHFSGFKDSPKLQLPYYA
jgi:hypothetical protein